MSPGLATTRHSIESIDQVCSHAKVFANFGKKSLQVARKIRAFFWANAVGKLTIFRYFCFCILEARDRLGHTPLILAAGFNDNSAVFELLLDQGADPAALSTEGLTARDLTQDNDALQGTVAYRHLSGLRSG